MPVQVTAFSWFECCAAASCLIPRNPAQGAIYVRKKDVKVRVEKQIGKHILSMETGLLARQASGAVLTQYGGTVVLSAVTTGPPRLGIDFFPLMCDYRERFAAAGKFPGGFLKREGRPNMKETLTSRLIDRPIRPLFPKGFNGRSAVSELCPVE